MQTILVADSDTAVTTLLKYVLEREGYHVRIVSEGNEVMKLAELQKFDFFIIARDLSKIDGLEVTKRLRKQSNSEPILLMTSRDGKHEKKEALEIGVNDFLTKPFSPRELTAKIKAVSQGTTSRKGFFSKKSNGKVITIGEFKIDLSQSIIEKNGVPLSLTKKEFELLAYFMERKNRVINRETLLQTVWNEGLYSNSRAIENQISNIRKKIEENPRDPKYLVTVRGFGYRLQEPKEKKNEKGE